MKISGGAILCARSWSTYFEAACSAGMAKLLPKKWHDFHSTIENLEMSIGRIEKDLLIFLLAIWVKVLNFMIYPFERQFNAEIPSSFYQAIFHYFQRFLLRGEKYLLSWGFDVSRMGRGRSSYLGIFHGGSILFDSIHQQSILLSLHHSKCHHQNRPHQYNY